MSRQEEMRIGLKPFKGMLGIGGSWRGVDTDMGGGAQGKVLTHCLSAVELSAFPLLLGSSSAHCKAKWQYSDLQKQLGPQEPSPASTHTVQKGDRCPRSQGLGSPPAPALSAPRPGNFLLKDTWL